MSLKIFVLLLLVTTTVFGGNKKKIDINVEDYNTCLTMETRPRYNNAVPSQDIELYGESFPATRHHIIPYNTIATFFNLVLREDHFNGALGAYLARRVREIYDIFDNNSEVGAFPAGRAPVVPSVRIAGRVLNFEVDMRMLSAFTWMPGNIFYGPPPNRRSDDPREEFEVNSERIIGSRAFATLQRIYTNMRHYIDNPAVRASNNFDGNAIIADLNEVDQRRNRPYDFNPRDWKVKKVDGKQMFAINTDVIEEDKRDELRKRAVSKPDVAVTFITSFTDKIDHEFPEDYLNAAHIVCEEINKQILSTKPKPTATVDNSCDNAGYAGMGGWAVGVLAGAAAGTALIPIPVVGTIVGAIFGGAIIGGASAGVTVAIAGC